MALDVPIVSMAATHRHTGAIATQVFGPGEALAGALALSGPVSRWSAEAVAVARPVLREAAATLTRRLGGAWPEMPRAAAEYPGCRPHPDAR